MHVTSQVDRMARKTLANEWIKMSSIHYCKSWFSAKKCPTVLWDEEQARAAHDNRTVYTALVGGLERPTHVVDVVDQFVAVDFLDEHLREILSYQFLEYEPGKMFLKTAIYREFDGDTDRVLAGSSYGFNQDGYVKIWSESFDPHLLEEAERFSIDVSGNFDRYPDFGDYDHLTVFERSASSDQPFVI